MSQQRFLTITLPEGNFLVAKFEFQVSFGMRLEEDHEVEVTPKLELLVIFGMCLEGLCRELYT
jgi:hypothetical protein